MTTLETWIEIQAKTIRDSVDSLEEVKSNKDLFLVQLYALKKQVDSSISWLKMREKYG